MTRAIANSLVVSKPWGDNARCDFVVDVFHLVESGSCPEQNGLRARATTDEQPVLIAVANQNCQTVFRYWTLPRSLNHDSSMDRSVISELAGADAVTQWFGDWPSFHDAEVISIFLARKGQSVLRVYPYHPSKPATVDFILEDVTDVELDDFSSQNVIDSLEVEISTDQNGDGVYRILLAPCYGVTGRIDAKSLRVKLSPGKSPDGVSQW
jgi:Immunity protein 50